MRIVKNINYWRRVAFSKPFFWMTVFFGLWYYRIAYMPASGGGLTTILQAGGIFGMFYFVLKKCPRLINMTLRTCLPVKTLFLFYCYAFISFTWAFLPFFSGFLSLQNLLLIFILYWFFSLFRTFENMERGFLIFFLTVDVLDVLWWRIVVQQSLFIHHLGAGSVAAMAIAYSLGEYLMEKRNVIRKRFLMKCIIVSLTVLVTSTSSGANASAVAASAIAFFVGGKIWVCMLMLLFALFLYMHPELVNTMILLIMPGKTMEIVESATGRERIWILMKELATQKPIFGWGFACIERAATEYGNVPTPDAHNNYLGFYGSLGIVGCFFAGIHFLSALSYSFARRMRKGYTGLFCATSCAIINGYSYGFLSGKACCITVMYFAVIMLMHFYKKVPLTVETRKNERIS